MPRPPGKPRPSSRVSRVRPGPDPGWARLVCREVGVQRALLPAWKVVLSRLLSGPLSWVFQPGRRAPVWLAFRAPAGRGLPSSPAMAPWVAHRFGKRFPFLFDVFLFRFAVSPSASRPQTRPSPSGLQDLRACGASVPPHGARRQPGAQSPEPVDAPAGGFPVSPSRRGPVYGDLPRGARTVRGPRPPRLARPSRPPFPLLLRRLHFHSPVRLKLSHPVSHPSWTFQNWEERFVFLTVSVSLPRLATLVSLHSRPVPAPSPELCSPRWAQGRADLGLRVRSPIPTPRPPNPQLGAEVLDTEFLPFSKRAHFWSGRPCVCECGFMRCCVVSEARPRCSSSSRDSARLRVQTPSPRLPSGRCGGLGV